ncbi:MAG TPA: magnesium/cobalt transporter CorA [Candidatus Bathyarchaeia archaeon]
MKVQAVWYSPTTLKQETFSSLEDRSWTRKDDSVLWLDVWGYRTMEELYPLQKSFGLHPLALEDCLHVRQRPKIDDYTDNLFLVTRTVSEKDGKSVEGEQLGIFMGRDFIITLHSEPMTQLKAVLGDLQKGKPQLAGGSPSFLLYVILDSVVDDLEGAVGRAEEKESAVGADVLKEPPPDNVLNSIYTCRSTLLLIRRLLRPQSDVVCRLVRGDFQLVDKKAEPFIRDVYDHTLRTLDRLDGLLDINMGSLNIYLSSVSNRMNNVMKLLTVISTIGVPLTVLVGWYGMNFENMPEIYWTYGYAIVALVATALVIGTVLLFKKKRWL